MYLLKTIYDKLHPHFVIQGKVNSYTNQKKPDLISQLPMETFLEIFSFLDLHSLHKSSQVCQEWRDIVTGNKLEKKFVYKHIAIGKNKWETFFDKDMFKGEKKDEDFDSLHDDIGLTLLRRVPTLDGSVKRVMDRDIFVWAFKKAYGQDVSLRGVGNLAKKYFPNTETGYRHVNFYVKTEFFDKTLEDSCWVLFTKTELDGSLGKSFKKQQGIVERYAKKTGIPYVVPSVLIAAICILAKYCLDKTCLFGYGPLKYIRCKELVPKRYQVVVGGFTQEGIAIGEDDFFDFGFLGVAGMRVYKVLGPPLLGN